MAETATQVVRSLFGMTLSKLEAVAREADLQPFAARQLADWLYRKHADSFDRMTNLSARTRQWLERHCTVGVSTPESVAESGDGTRKYLFEAASGRFVETAFIPEGTRATLCLSVQVGCRMGCVFCATGRQGFQGNLGPGAILNQYRSLPERDRITNVVYMGMGEPLDNLDNVLDSLEVFGADWGYGLSPARITVSTVGLVPAMRSFLARSRCHLAVSMHSPFEEERRTLMPVEHAYPLHEVLDTIRECGQGGRRRISFEYIMFDGVNDTRRHARELARILEGIHCRINLIPFHPIPGPPLRPSPREQIERFQSWLKASGIMTTIRASRGLDIAAACGLLSTRRLVAAAQTAD